MSSEHPSIRTEWSHPWDGSQAVIMGNLHTLTVSQLFPVPHPIPGNLNGIPSPASGTAQCQSSKRPGATLTQVLGKSEVRRRSSLQAAAPCSAASSTTVLAPGHSHLLSSAPRGGLGPWG